MPPNPRPPTPADDAARARAASLIGTVLAQRYRILDLIAMGGVGAVYLGEHVLLHKKVAIKVLHPDSQSLPDLVARFDREAIAGAHVQHPNVAAATDFGEIEDGSRFLVLEYIRGTTLRELIKRGPLPPGRAVHIARQIAAALGAAHAMGILHRDVKPRNVMLIEGERDVVKLIDFGLAKVDMSLMSSSAMNRTSLPDEPITGIGAVFGTIAYLAPEAARGMELVDARADLYALGVVLYEMLAGKHPFDATNPVALFKHHNSSIPPPISVRAPDVAASPGVEAVAMRLLEKAPDARYASAEALISALDAAAGDITASQAPVVPSDISLVFAGPSMLPSALDSKASSPSMAASVRPEALPASPSSRSVPEIPQAKTSNPGPLAAANRVSGSQDVGTPVRASASAAAISLSESASSKPLPARHPVIWGAGMAAVVTVVACVLAVAWRMPVGSGSKSRSSADPSGSTPAVPSIDRAAVLAGSIADGGPSAPLPSSPEAGAPGASAAMPPAVARVVLRRAVAANDLAHATPAFFALIDGEPASMRDPLIVGTVRDLATTSAGAAVEDADRIFDTLTVGLGSDGLDILYEIVRARGGSKAAARAEQILRRPDVIARATPAMRISFELRSVPCADKLSLLDRAAAEGDGRTLMVLDSLAASCFGKSQTLDDTIRALKARLRKP